MLFPSLNINSQIGLNSTFSIPFNIEYAFNDYISITHQNRLYHLDHPHHNYLHNNNSRENISAITEISVFKFNYSPFNLSFGRDYMNNYNKLFFSDFAPSMDHFKLNYTKNNFDYNYLLIKLNNDLITDEDLDENKYINS